MGWNRKDIFVDLDTMEEVRILIRNFRSKGTHLTYRRALTDKEKELYKDTKQDGRI